eukprot:5565444-Prymnesium_polylepis.1
MPRSLPTSAMMTAGTKVLEPASSRYAMHDSSSTCPYLTNSFFSSTGGAACTSGRTGVKSSRGGLAQLGRVDSPGGGGGGGAGGKRDILRWAAFAGTGGAAVGAGASGSDITGGATSGAAAPTGASGASSNKTCGLRLSAHPRSAQD